MNLGIWEISQIPRHLGNSPNSYNLQGCIFLRFWKFLLMTGYLGNFPKNLDIWEISQIPKDLGNSPNSYRYLRMVNLNDFGNFSNNWIFGKFLKCLGIWGIPKCLGILEISSHLRNFQNLKNIPHSNNKYL